MEDIDQGEFANNQLLDRANILEKYDYVDFQTFFEKIATKKHNYFSLQTNVYSSRILKRKVLNQEVLKITVYVLCSK